MLDLVPKEKQTKIRLSGHWKLFTFVMLALLLFIPVTFQGYLIGTASTRTIDNQYGKFVSMNMKTLALILESYINQIEDFSRSLSSDEKLADMLKREDISGNSSRTLDILNYLSNQYQLRLPVNILVLSAKGNLYTNTPINRKECQNFRRTVRDFSWLGSNIKLDERILYQNFAPDFHEMADPGNSLYVSKNIVSNGAHLGLLVLEMNKSVLSRLLDKVQVNPQTTVFITDRFGHLLIENEYNELDLTAEARQTEEWISSRSLVNGGEHVRWRGQDYMYFYQVVPEIGWNIVTLTPSRLLFSNSQSIKRITLILLICSIVIVFFIFYWFIRSVTQPVLAMSKIVRKATRGDYEPHYHYRGIKELEVLSTGIDTLLHRIESQIQQIQTNENIKRELEIELLQSQIRPHFVQNSLISLRWLAEENEDYKLVQALISFNKIIGYTFRNSGEIWVTLRDELDYVRNYIEFQQTLICQNIVLRLKVDEECLDLAVPKLTLQPIVENAIFHGFKGMEDDRSTQLLIEVRSTGSEIVISIEDNGFGMDEKDIAELMSDDGERPMTVGLHNVRRRLQLNMGDRVRMHVRSAIDVGTRIDLILPRTNETRGKQDETHVG